MRLFKLLLCYVFIATLAFASVDSSPQNHWESTGGRSMFMSVWVDDSFLNISTPCVNLEYVVVCLYGVEYSSFEIILPISRDRIAKFQLSSVPIGEYNVLIKGNGETKVRGRIIISDHI